MNYLSYLAINKFTFIANICLFAAVVFLFIIYIILKFLYTKRRYLKTTEDRSAPQHALFVDLSPKAADVVELAVEVWRINNRITKSANNLTEIQKRGIESSLQRFLKFLDRYDIKIVDHTGEKYNEGMNVDVLSFEKDESIKMPLVKETIEPSITYKGHVIKKGKIIVVNK